MFIRPVTRNDVPSIAAIISQAFKHDELHEYIWPYRHAHPEDYHQFIVTRLRARMVGYGELGFVVVSEEKDVGWNGEPEIMGYASFIRGGDDEGAKKWRVDPWFNKLERKLFSWESWYHNTFIDRACDSARLNNYFKLSSWDDYPSLKSCWRLGILCVSPEYQRRGVGKILVEHGQKIAREEGLPMTLESSVVGRKLYFKKGFKVVAERAIEGYSDLLMVWESEQCKGKWLEESDGEKARVRDVAL